MAIVRKIKFNNARIRALGRAHALLQIMRGEYPDTVATPDQRRLATACYIQRFMKYEKGVVLLQRDAVLIAGIRDIHCQALIMEHIEALELVLDTEGYATLINSNLAPCYINFIRTVKTIKKTRTIL